MKLPLLLFRIAVVALLSSVAGAEQASFEDAKRTYDAFQLPYPPPGAALVSVGYRKAFVLREATEDSLSELLVGTEVEEGYGRSVGLLKIDIDQLDDSGLDELLRPSSPGANVVLAIQLDARGESASALRIWSRVVVEVGVELPRVLSEVAWYHWEAALTWPGTDRRVALGMLKHVLELDPERGSAEQKELIHALESTLEPRTASTDATERLIDDLSEAGARTERGVSGGLDLMERLVVLGFDAVPVLMRHVADERLTRRLAVDSLSGRTHILTIGELVRLLLFELSEGEVPLPIIDEGKAYVQWWEKTHGSDEGAYLEAHAFRPSGKLTWPNGTVCLALAARHPRRLLSLYRRILKDPSKCASHTLAELIPGLALPRSDLVSALVDGAKNADPNVRQGALYVLCDFDPDICVPLLVHELDSLPESPRLVSGEQYGGSYGHLLAMDVIYVDRSPAWEALERAARRADPPDRRDLVCSSYYGARDEERTLHKLRFLSHFLDDHSMVGNRPADGDRTLRPEERWRICDHVARQMAYTLRMPDEDESARSTEEWDAFAEKVREEFARRDK